MHESHLLPRLTLLLTAVAIAACGGTSTRITKTLHDRDYAGDRFSNVLVIAVGDDYDKRAQFEREIVSGIRHAGADATAYYSVVEGNAPISVDEVKKVVRQRNMDSVLFTRVKDAAQSIKVKSGPASAQATVKGGSLVDLFRYDYEELDEPDTVRTRTDVTLITELYAAQSEKKIWAIESSGTGSQSVELLIDSEAKAILKQLSKDKLIGPK